MPTQKNRKEREECGKIYHTRNVIRRENVITSGWTNELYGMNFLFSCEELIAYRMGLGSTTLHYLVVWQVYTETCILKSC